MQDIRNYFYITFSAHIQSVYFQAFRLALAGVIHQTFIKLSFLFIIRFVSFVIQGVLGFVPSLFPCGNVARLQLKHMLFNSSRSDPSSIWPTSFPEPDLTMPPFLLVSSILIKDVHLIFLMVNDVELNCCDVGELW